MFPRPINYTKLKTSLRLARNNLKLLIKKKSDLIRKSKYYISDCIRLGKLENTRIGITNVLREEYYVKGLDIIDMYCYLLIARMDIIIQMKVLEDSIAEPVASIIWVTPRLQHDIPELRTVSDILIIKYGEPYANAISMEPMTSINSNLMYSIQMISPPDIVVEKHMMALAQSLNIVYVPNEDIIKEDYNSGMLNTFLNDLDKVPTVQPPFNSETTICSPSTVS